MEICWAKFFYGEHALAYPNLSFSMRVVQPSNYAGNHIINSQTAIGRYPIVVSSDMLGKQLHYSLKPVKHG